MHERGAGTFLRYEEVGGVQAAVLERRTSVTLDSSGNLEAMAGMFAEENLRYLEEHGVELRIDAEGAWNALLWIDPLNGQLLRSEGGGFMSLEMRLLGGPPGTDFPTVGFTGDTSTSFERR